MLSLPCHSNEKQNKNQAFNFPVMLFLLRLFRPEEQEIITLDLGVVVLVPLLVIPIVVHNLTLNIQGVALLHKLLDYRSFLVPDLYPVPLRGSDFLALLVLIGLGGGKRESSQDYIPVLFTDLWHFANITHQGSFVNTVLHNCFFL